MYTSILRLGAVFSASILVVLLSSCATMKPVSEESGKEEFHMVDGKLYRGSDRATIMGFQVPDAGARGAGLDVMVSSLAHIAEVGGNTICFDLAGFSKDGKTLDPSILDVINAYVERGNYQRTRVVVRVSGCSSCPIARENAVKTAAKTLTDPRALYLIDGPDAAELAKIFKKRARNLTLIAPANGDIPLVTEVPKEAPAQDVVVMGALPNLDMENVHFILNGAEEDYAALDAALMRPEEKKEWKLDPSVVSEAERKEGFVPMFDGKTLDGWWMKDDDPDAFHVSEDGFIEWREHGGGALMSAKRYANFIFRCEWKILPGGNSGIWFRAPRDARQSKIGFEMQMQGDSEVAEFNESNTGSIYDVIPPVARPAHKEGLWNTIEVTCDGPKVKVLINDVVVQDISFDDTEELKYRLRKGFICLTDHNCYVAFRNLRIKELP